MPIGRDFLSNVAVDEEADWESEGGSDRLASFIRRQVLDESDDC